MADLTRADLIDRVLEHLGVKGATQSASAADAKLVGEVVDSLHSRLRGEDLAPFELSAIPPWAQVAMRDLTALEVAPSFGLGGAQLQTVAMSAQSSRKALVKARSGPFGLSPVRARYY